MWRTDLSPRNFAIGSHPRNIPHYISLSILSSNESGAFFTENFYSEHVTFQITRVVGGINLRRFTASHHCNSTSFPLIMPETPRIVGSVDH